MLNWREIIIKGNEKTLRGFVIGFEAGAGNRGCVLFGSDFGLDDESLSDLIGELFSTGSHHPIYTNASMATKLIEGLHDRGNETDLSVVSVADVVRVSLAFKIAAFSEDTVAGIRRVLLESLPSGVEIIEFSENESREPESEPTGVYAPIHHFSYSGSGIFVGQLPGILEMRRRSAESEFVTVEPIRLERR